ncbi:hypothetical protein GCM10027578_34380 [Spirosoma luteolum]
MPSYTILQQHDPAPAAIPPFASDGFLFNDADHLCQQQNGGLHLLTALNQTTRRADGRCAFFISSSGAVSPKAAPFGSVEFTRQLPDAILNQLLISLADSARSLGVSSLRLVNYPDCYAPDQARRLCDQLLGQGFRLVDTNDNFYLPVGDEPFALGVDAAERRRLRKCRQAGFRVERWQQPDAALVNAFIGQIRQQRRHALTLAPAQLATLLHQFPDQFQVFTVRDAGQLVALSVTVRVRRDILYNFLPVSDPAYDAFSPMVLLTEGLYAHCQQHAIGLLDLGVSLDSNRLPKPSLMRFKRNLGAQTSPKRVFEKVL